MDIEANTEHITGLAEEAAPKTRSRLEFNFERYQPYIEDPRITEQQQREVLRTLFEIMTAFIDLGFGCDPIHHLFGALATKSLQETDDRSQQGMTAKGLKAPLAVNAHNPNDQGGDR